MPEHRTPEIKTLLSDIDKIMKEEERKAYIDTRLKQKRKRNWEIKNIKMAIILPLLNIIPRRSEEIRTIPSIAVTEQPVILNWRHLISA